MSTSATPTPTRGVPVTLNGAEYRLRYSMRMLRRIREEMGAEVLMQGVVADNLCTMLWYGLGAETSPLSKDDLDDAVDLENMADVVTALQKAMGMKPTPSAPLPAPAAPEVASGT